MKRVFFLTLYFVAALAVAGLSGYLVTAYLVQKAPEVKVPDITDLALSDALDKLNEVGLDLEVRDFTYSDLVKENRVVIQRPQPGEVVKAGRAVGVVLSRGSKRYPVPDVLGKRLEEAAIMISEAGLNYEIGGSIPGGQTDEVMGINREPGQKLNSGETVRILVSSGPKPVVYRMPRVEGMRKGEAEATLSRLGLVIDRIEMVNLGDSSGSGNIISQDPPAGYPVERGQAVTLSAATGSR